MTQTIALGYLHPGTVRAEFMDSVMRAVGRSEHRYVRIAVRSGAEIARGRNKVFRAAAELGVDYLWWLDSDIVFNQDAPDRLIANDRAICSALYFGQEETGVEFPVFSIIGANGLRRGTMRDVRAVRAAKGLLEVAGTGMGCCMIRGDVLTTLIGNQPELEPLWPYGEITSDAYGATEADITFGLRAKAHGFPTWIDPKVTVGHVKDRVIWP